LKQNLGTVNNKLNVSSLTGPFGHFIHGVHEENYIAYVMAYSACIGPYANDCHSLKTGRTPKS
jgi:hypothetical protein